MVVFSNKGGKLGFQLLESDAQFSSVKTECVSTSFHLHPLASFHCCNCNEKNIAADWHAKSVVALGSEEERAVLQIPVQSDVGFLLFANLLADRFPIFLWECFSSGKVCGSVLHDFRCEKLGVILAKRPKFAPHHV